MDKRTAIISKIKNREIEYKDIPKELKDDEQIALLAIENNDGRICEFIGDRLKNSIDFAKKVFKNKYGYSLQYFSDRIKNNFECCKTSIIDGVSGYNYIGVKMKYNKELALAQINTKHYHDIRRITKKLRIDKDIIKAHWEKINKYPSLYSDFCSIIGIDDFGNRIIDTFKNEELKRHIQSRIDIYEEKTESVQFIKCINGKLEHKIFKPVLNPFIIIIGKDRNQIANEIIKKHYDKNSKYINIIEIYKTDVTTKNIKFISNKEIEIKNLLRIITYTTAGDSWLTEDNLNDIKELLLKNKMENKNIKISFLKSLSDLNETETSFFKGETYIIQVVSNNEHSLHEYGSLMNKIEEILNQDKNLLQVHIHNSCNFKDFEIYILILD